MARTSIDLRYIEDVQKRRACFSKRRQGLMKKAHELSVLCDADIGLIVFSDSHKLYEFASSDMTHIMMRYRAATHAPPLPPLEAQPDMSRCLEEKEAEIRSLKKKVMLLESEKDDEQGLSRLDNPKMEFRSAITRRPSKLSIMEIFGPEYLRRPTITDIEKLYAFHEEKHEFSEMLRSLDCTDWEWFGYPQAYKGQYVRRDHCPNPFILLEIPFVANDVTYPLGYYLCGGIYPEWVPFVMSVSNLAEDDYKRLLHRRKHEATRKDMEWAFGVLKKK
ncbi:transcription factor, MADS-box [Tanacetum coccineum]